MPKKQYAIDSSKFDKISFVTFNEFKPGDKVVTENKPVDSWKKYLNEKNVQLYVSE